MRAVVLVGPTAIGKSQLALHLALSFSGEIVNADSRQVYRYMDIGTGKPSLEQRSLVPHHLIDIADPDEVFTLAQYQGLAYKALEDINRRGKLPFLVGGSGLYVWAVMEGWQIPSVAPDLPLRQNLLQRAKEDGGGALYEELKRIDPLAAERIDPRNLRRVIRALEVTISTGVPFSRFQVKKPPPYDMLILGLTAERQELYRRIDHRVDSMVEKGLVEETRKLLEIGYSFALPSMSGLGYRQMGMHLEGALSLPEAIQRMKFETHRFARHQYAWFSLRDERIHWFDVARDSQKPIGSVVDRFLVKADN